MGADFTMECFTNLKPVLTLGFPGICLLCAADGAPLLISFMAGKRSCLISRLKTVSVHILFLKF